MEPRSKNLYEFAISPEDFEVQWEFSVQSHDVIFGVTFARAPGSLSPPPPPSRARALTQAARPPQPRTEVNRA